MNTKYCKYCHETKDINLFYKGRSMADGYLNRCKKCYSIYTKQRYSYNGYNGSNNKMREDALNYYYAHKEKRQKYQLEYYYRVRESENYKKKKCLRDKIRCDLKDRGTITIGEINELLEKSENICFWCDCDIPKGELHLDHVYPLSKGGGHTISNLVVSCSSCNAKKHAKHPEQFLDEVLNVS